MSKAMISSEKLNSILLIQKRFRIWKKTINTLKPVVYNKQTIDFNSIYLFMGKNQSKSKNDKHNKIRESIIECIINDNIPKQYYRLSLRWSNIKKGIYTYIETLCREKNIDNIYHIECIHKGGRIHKYDFMVIISTLNRTYEFKIEFKFNTSNVKDTPQFVSPMKPSQYLESSYEEYYYNNYFIQLIKQYNLELPEKETYLKEIHSSYPDCLKAHQEKYRQGCKKSKAFSNLKNDIDFYNTSKKLSRDSISSFISSNTLNQGKLTDYLLESQKDKYYMLYKNGTFYLETINNDNYIITDVTNEPKKNRYIAQTKSGIFLNILLRWKNGNGIALPSFQISLNNNRK